jgi:nucleoside-diphosphate-sugar epimerase
MKVLITGVGGFIGSHLAEKLLSLGYEVYGIDNFDGFYSRDIKNKNLELAGGHPNFRMHELDITNPDTFKAFEKESFSVVYHLAAKAGVRPSIKAPAQYLKTNVEGTLNLLEYMKSVNQKKLVFASSSSIYGNSKIIPFSEDSVTDQPISPYAFSKKSCELLNYYYHNLYGMDIINLRFFTVYGPRQRPDLAIHKFVRQISNNEPIEIYGDGSAARDFTFIDDIITGVVNAGDYLLKNNHVFETINLGNNSPVTVANLVDLLRKQLGRDFPVTYNSMQEGDVDITYANINKAKSLLGYDPATGFEKGLTEFIKWYNHSFQESISK